MFTYYWVHLTKKAGRQRELYLHDSTVCGMENLTTMCSYWPIVVAAAVV